MEERTISFETANEMMNVIAFTIIQALKNSGIPIRDIERLTDTINEITKDLFTSYCECENITEVSE